MIIGKIRETQESLKLFVKSLHPVTITLLMMLFISVPVTLVSSGSKNVNKASQADICDFFKHNKPSTVAIDVILKTPLKEEMKYRWPIFVLSLFKKFISFENPLVMLFIIIPGMFWSEGHTIPVAALIDSIFLGWLVFKIGGVRGFLSALIVHTLVNSAVFIGYFINFLSK